MLSDAYDEALEYSEQSIAVAVTRQDRETAVNIKGCALVLLRRTKEGSELLEKFRDRCFADGDLYSLSTVDGIIGVSQVLQGNISKGIYWLEDAILRRDAEGYRACADWYRFFLCEVYLQIIGGKEKLPFSTLMKKSANTSEGVCYRSLAHSRTDDARAGESAIDSRGTFCRSRAIGILGELYKIKKKAPACGSASDRGKANPFAIRTNSYTRRGSTQR